MNFKLDLYRERVKLKDPIFTNEDGLWKIQTAQLTSIPFENIDCFNKHPIKLDLESLENKILKQKRGGYCFELNLLLQHALISNGFKARPILSRSMWRGTNINARTHIFLLVEIGNKQFIADAGFGGPGIFTPLPFEIGREDVQRNGDFRLISDAVFGTILQKKNQELNEWSNVYSFSLENVFPADIEMSNYFTYNLETSYFRQNLVAALFTDFGRITLLNNKLNKLHFEGQLSSVDITDETMLAHVLKNDFHLDL